MMQAQRLLSRGDLAVTEVAKKVGYTSLQRFSAAFRKETGASPRQHGSAARRISLSGMGNWLR